MGDCTKTNASCVHRSVLRVCFQVSLFFPQWSFSCRWRTAACPHLVSSRWLFENAVGQCQHYILDYIQSGRTTHRLCRLWCMAQNMGHSHEPTFGHMEWQHSGGALCGFHSRWERVGEWRYKRDSEILGCQFSGEYGNWSRWGDWRKARTEVHTNSKIR